ncbi:MAG: SMC family ATPase, partial [Chloroflexi bacterium]|nr:SMC family ATPase [Chloroflexota bacterium]
MIPIRLTVKNFMCYRDDVPALDLEGIHVACLCGDNGHGKSALLDAITWALWGEARTRTQEELVHQGQTDMAVELEFETQGQRYRVSRKHSRSARSKQGATLLELQVSSGDGFRPITGNTVRDTEAKICEVLHMDFQTFVSTAFLRQGDADRFTNAKAAERKQILAEVLDLSYYDRLEQKARERSRALHDEIRDADSRISMHQQELSKKPEYAEKLASVLAALSALTPQVESQHAKVEELRRNVSDLRTKRQELQPIESRIAEVTKEINDLEKQVAKHRAKVSEDEAVLEREEEIREQFAALAGAITELERLDAAFRARSALQNEKTGLEGKINGERIRLQSTAEQLRSRISKELEPKVARLPEIEEALAGISEEQAFLDAQGGEIQLRRKEAEEMTARIAFLDSANASLRKEMEETRKKFDMLEQGDSTCPLCKQPLDDGGQEHLRQEYERQGRESKNGYSKTLSEKKSLEQCHKQLTGDISRQDADLQKKRQQLERKSTNLQRDKAESSMAQGELHSAQDELTRQEAVLNSGGFSQKECQRVAQIDAELATLGYDEELHTRTREQKQSLAPYDELNRKLEAAYESLPAERDALEAAQRMLVSRKQDIEDGQQRKGALEAELKALPSLEKDFKEADALFRKLEGQLKDADREKAIAEHQLERCEAIEKEMQQNEERRRGLIDEKSIYDDLSAAFGKNGIQALIIESAIPQMERDANELLSRLTENRMFLRLQLQEGRRQAGVPTEELDIKIADEVGTRSYETFSGG